jgi:MFS family permease
MSKNNNLVLVTSFLGSTIVFYDFIIYLLLSPILVQIFFDKIDSHNLIAIYIIFAAGYLIRPIGGIIAANFGDRISRKNTILASIFLMAISTVYLGTLPSYNTLGNTAAVLLLILRLFQGIALGSELPGGITLVFEHAPKEKKIFNTAFIFLGVEFGIIVSLGIFFCINAILSPEEMMVWGWRPLFLLGAILTAIVWSLRFKIKDTTSFLRLKSNGKLKSKPFIHLIKNFKTEVIIGVMLVLGGFSILISLFGLLFPNILSINFQYTIQEGYANTLLFAVLYMLFTIVGAAINQNFSHFRTKIIYYATIILMICSFLVYPILQSHSYIEIIILYITITLCLGFITSMIPYILSNLFPTQIRFTGLATSYNVAQAIGGGITPLLVTIFINRTHIYLYFSGIMLVASLLIITSLTILRIKNKTL